MLGSSRRGPGTTPPSPALSPSEDFPREAPTTNPPRAKAKAGATRPQSMFSSIWPRAGVSAGGCGGRGNRAAARTSSVPRTGARRQQQRSGSSPPRNESIFINSNCRSLAAPRSAVVFSARALRSAGSRAKPPRLHQLRGSRLAAPVGTRPRARGTAGAIAAPWAPPPLPSAPGRPAGAGAGLELGWGRPLSVPFVFTSLLTRGFFFKRRLSSLKSQAPSCTPFTNGFSRSSSFFGFFLR